MPLGRTRLPSFRSGRGLHTVLRERFRELDRRRSINEPSEFLDNSSRPPAEESKSRVIYVDGQLQYSDGASWNIISFGGATSFATPSIVLGTAAAAGSTSSVIRSNSTIKAFDTTNPADIATSAGTGSVAFTARRDHVHAHPTFASDDLHTQYLRVDGTTRDMTGELGTDVGTFRSDVADGGVGFSFNTANSFASGTIFRFRENGSTIFSGDFEGHFGVNIAPISSTIFRIGRTLSSDNRNTFNGMLANPIIDGSFTGVLGYNITLVGADVTAQLAPASITTILTSARSVSGGLFGAQVSNAASTKATTMLARGGFFTVSGNTDDTWTDAIGGDFAIQGDWSNGLTNAYGIRTRTITKGTNRWGANIGNRAVITSPAADAQEVLSLIQANTGDTDGVHIKLDDKAGDPGTPAAGDIWRNSSTLNVQTSAGGTTNLIPTVVSKTEAYTAVDSDYAIVCDASGGAFTVTLPAASGRIGRVYHIKKTDSSGNAVTIDGNASETIDGSTTKTISIQYDSIMIAGDGSNWHII